jgi:hypothetical protein
MLKKSENTISNRLTSSRAASRAKISAKPEKEPESKMAQEADFGLSMPESFGSYDQSTSSWKTSHDSCETVLDKSSVIWPKSGMMRNGRVYQRPEWVPRIAEKESSLLLTPIEMDGSGGVSTMALGYKRAKPHGFGSLSEQLNVAYGLRPDAAFMEMMMGYPEDWTLIEGQPSETRSCRKSRK